MKLIETMKLMKSVMKHLVAAIIFFALTFSLVSMELSRILSFQSQKKAPKQHLPTRQVLF